MLSVEREKEKDGEKRRERGRITQEFFRIERAWRETGNKRNRDLSREKGRRLRKRNSNFRFSVSVVPRPASTMGSNSLKEYLKRYESNTEEDKKKKKKKQKKKTQPQATATGLLVVDEDPMWQKPVDLGEEEGDNPSDEEKPLVDEDIEVKRMRRLEQLRASRPYHALSEDGSGWVPLSPKHLKNQNLNTNMSPPRKQKVRNDTPSPEPELNPSTSNREDFDLSPPRQRLKRYDTPSPEHDTRLASSKDLDSDLSPARKKRAELKPSDSGNEVTDLSPPRQQRKDPRAEVHATNPNPDISPPRRPRHQTLGDYGKRKHETSDLQDFSPPRRHHDSPYQDNMHGSPRSDLSPPRKSRKDVRRTDLSDLSSRRSHSPSTVVVPRRSLSPDLSPPRKSQKEKAKTGLISGKDMREEIERKKKDDLMRFKQMDPDISGRGAEPVYRDKTKGERISKEEYLKSKQKVEEKPKEKVLEWGKGLAQKREAEASLKELELEKEKPFARTRDDPDLDKMLKDRVRWGDPMAHLVKKKYPEPVLPNLGDNEKMKESGFVVPQDIPNHSWLKRGLSAAPNRYGIRPGRHWDGVDRSNGFEKGLFKRTNERQARDKEAYLWSVSDM
ncbi:hypothetical protein L6164_007037 [Bauhinia variegata]|uniref:Uncharacterized protein n=1 Tax=Bauhinia variegata TaxID=167791 RepID=A0ACB9PWA4_BAUVA|nr:hypothetical protein L6164_007037 [Bauhinia variegata]